MNATTHADGGPRSLSIVVPVYNAAGTLQMLVERLEPVLRPYLPHAELVLVNDASSDGTAAVMDELAAAYPWIRAIELMKNYGQHNALLCGIRAARYAVTVTMDDDLEHPPEEIGTLVAALDDGHDVIYGRPVREQHGLLRNIASRVTKLALSTSMGVEVARDVSAFRAFRTQLRDSFAHYRGPFVSIDVLLTWGTTRFSAVRVRHDPRAVGESNYTFGRLLTHALNMTTGFSVLPLQVASAVGVASALFGVGVLLYVLVRFLVQGVVVPGFAFLASIVAVFSGAQLLALGIIGEYLARVHFRAMDRPAYVVRSDSGR